MVNRSLFDRFLFPLAFLVCWLVNVIDHSPATERAGGRAAVATACLFLFSVLSSHFTSFWWRVFGFGSVWLELDFLFTSLYHSEKRSCVYYTYYVLGKEMITFGLHVAHYWHVLKSRSDTTMPCFCFLSSFCASLLFHIV